MIERAQVWVQWYQTKLPTWVRAGMACGWAGVIWWLSSRPGTGEPSGPLRTYVMNSAHVVVFGVLAGLILLSSPRCTGSRVLFAILATVLYGVADEFHQSFVAGRIMDGWDVCSDALGACIVTTALWWILAEHRAAGRFVVPLILLAAGSVHMAGG